MKKCPLKFIPGILRWVLKISAAIYEQNSLLTHYTAQHGSGQQWHCMQDLQCNVYLHTGRRYTNELAKNHASSSKTFPVALTCFESRKDLFLDFFLVFGVWDTWIGIMDEGIERIIFFLGQGFPNMVTVIKLVVFLFVLGYKRHHHLSKSPQKCGLLEMIYTIFVYITWRSSGWLWKARSKINGRETLVSFWDEERTPFFMLNDKTFDM